MARRYEYHMIFGGTRNGSSKIYPVCPIHQAVAMACAEALTGPNSPGFFLKEEIIRNAGISEYMGDQLHWTFILRYLQKEYQAPLISLANSFFESRQVTVEEDDGTRRVVTSGSIYDQLTEAQAEAERTGNYDKCIRLAGRGIAGGNGKKTVGYASYQGDAGVMVLARLDSNDKIAKGIEQISQTMVTKAQQEGVKGLPPQENLLTNE